MAAATEPRKLPNDWSGVPVVVTFSGGKDSVATWLYLREMGANVTCLFSDTGWEAEETYAYIDELKSQHGCQITRIQPLVRHLWENDPPDYVPRDEWEATLDMREAIRRKKRPPGKMAKYCTSVLKVRPLRDWIKANTNEAMLLATGVRAEESTKRAKYNPWEFDQICGRWRFLPIHSWPVGDVFAIHKRHGVPVNPLYLKGASRVGCWPCILCKKSELAVFARDARGLERVRALERDFGVTFFPMDKVAKAYRSQIDAKTGKRICTIDDVARWALDQQPAFKVDSMFADDELSIDYGDDPEEVCSSVYGLCE